MDSRHSDSELFINNVPALGVTDEDAIMAHRDDYGKVLNQLELLNEGVEVGVCEGYYSFVLLSTWQGKKLYSIDPWKVFGAEYQDINNVSQGLHDLRYESVKKKLAPFKERSEIIRLTSLEGAQLFADESLDFVYLDAQHSYEAVKADIETWYPKIKKGGLISGHDYFDVVIDCGDFGVRKAVNEFVKTHQLKIYVSVETHINEVESWFVVKR